MIKTLTNVGNSKAVIIPKQLVDKYALDSFRIEEVENGILIVPEQKSRFNEKVRQARADKKEIYARMKSQSEHVETQDFYSNEALPDIIDEP